jgi:probable F420-dependent oxidoreductase
MVVPPTRFHRDLVPRRFRFGLQVSGAGSRSEWIATAREAEALGFSTLLLPDHVGSQLSPFAALMSAADATSTLRVGTLVLDNDFRNPLVLAHEAATVDLLTDGRLELGIGAGWSSADYDATGIRFDPPDVRVARLAASLEVIRDVLGGHVRGSEERYVDVRIPENLPRPAQARVPILVGGGSRRVLEVAGRLADIVSIHNDLRHGAPRSADVTRAATERKIGWVREGAAGRFSGIELQIGLAVLWITPRARNVLTSLSRTMQVSVEELSEMPSVLVGSLDEIVSRLRLLREHYGFSYIVVQARDLKAAIQVVAALNGS